MADSKYTGTVRHGIQFYGITANIPKSLSSYPGFTYNQNEARISFIVADGTSWKKGLIGNTVYSTDPKIQDFNKAFSAANTKADWSKIKSYDFAVNEAQPPQPIAQQNTPRPTPAPAPINPTPTPNVPNNQTPEGATSDPNKKDDKKIWYLAAAGIGAFFFFGKKGKRKR